MKKLFAVVLAAISLTTLIGCKQWGNRYRYLPEYESGYFKYAVRTEKDGTKKAYLTGLTESGQKLKEIIYPEEIDGITVYGIGYEKPLGIGSEYVGSFGSDNLEKLYFYEKPKEDLQRSEVLDMQNTFIVYLNICEIFEGFIDSAGEIIGYKYYVDNVIKPYQYDNLDRIANVSYMYNYEEAPNEGYYWVDSYNESLITFIPPEPKREGYKFGGWYKEPECLNEWNFDTDMTGKEIVIGRNVYDAYDGIYLYAKWINQ